MNGDDIGMLAVFLLVAFFIGNGFFWFSWSDFNITGISLHGIAWWIYLVTFVGIIEISFLVFILFQKKGKESWLEYTLVNKAKGLGISSLVFFVVFPVVYVLSKIINYAIREQEKVYVFLIGFLIVLGIAGLIVIYFLVNMGIAKLVAKTKGKR
jgi:hypothetical protein